MKIEMYNKSNYSGYEDALTSGAIYEIYNDYSSDNVVIEKLIEKLNEGRGINKKEKAAIAGAIGALNFSGNGDEYSFVLATAYGPVAEIVAEEKHPTLQNKGFDCHLWISYQSYWDKLNEEKRAVEIEMMRREFSACYQGDEVVILKGQVGWAIIPIHKQRDLKCGMYDMTYVPGQGTISISHDTHIYNCSGGGDQIRAGVTIPIEKQIFDNNYTAHVDEISKRIKTMKPGQQFIIYDDGEKDSCVFAVMPNPISTLYVLMDKYGEPLFCCSEISLDEAMKGMDEALSLTGIKSSKMTMGNITNEFSENEKVNVSVDLNKEAYNTRLTHLKNLINAMSYGSCFGLGATQGKYYCHCSRLAESKYVAVMDSDGSLYYIRRADEVIKEPNYLLDFILDLIAKDPIEEFSFGHIDLVVQSEETSHVGIFVSDGLYCSIGDHKLFKKLCEMFKFVCVPDRFAVSLSTLEKVLETPEGRDSKAVSAVSLALSFRGYADGFVHFENS